MFTFIEINEPSIILANKPIGKTPLEIIEYLKQKDKYKNVKMSYAGRLDPMAHGLMIILLNKECLNQHLYHNFSKIYRFKLLLGISTDTYDILGKITNNNFKNINNQLLYSTIENLKGTHNQDYPPFSSVRVNKHPLWYYAKNNKLDTITIPSKQINIYSITIEDDFSINYNELKLLVNKNISQLNTNHNFRQHEIVKEWDSIKDIPYKVITISANVSCGTYIRSISNLIGEQIGVPSIALDIYRTVVGDYKLEQLI
jgi:tRNA pseudouridine(55) synthase